MGSAKVITKEIDLSTRVPSFPGVYGGIVLPATKGPIDKNILITSDVQLLDVFTADGRVEVGMSVAYFSALAYLQRSNKLWVRRVVNGALSGGAAIKSFPAVSSNFALAAGMSDPTAYAFDSLPDVAAVAEVTQLVFSQLGSFYDVIGAGKAIQLYNSPAVGHYFWFNVTDGANAPQTDPVLVGTGHQVDILMADTSAQVATKLFNAVALVVAAFTATNSVASQVIITNVTAGTATDATATGTAAAVTVQTQGAAAVSAVDEALLIYQANPGAWGTKVAIKLTTYTTDPDYVKEPGAFIIDIYKLSNLQVPVESHLCSRVQGALDGFGSNIFVEDKLLSSNYIRAISNPAIAESILPKDQATPLTLAGGTDGAAVTDAEMITGLDNFQSRDDMLLTVVMDGGWTTPAFHQAIDTLCRITRKDCVGILGTPFSAEASATYMDDIVDYKKSTLNLDSSYSALYTPHVKAYDKFNNRQIFVGPDGYAAAAISYSASNFEIWFPPAGFKRGAVTVLDVRRRFTEGERDVLYDTGINPMRFVPGRGIFIWGQKTLSSRPSALDRLNVRLMLIVIEPAVAEALEDFLFELNDEATRSLASALVSSYMDNIRGRRGVTDYRVVCDSSNNSAADIDAGRLNLWLFVKPTRSTEEIPFSVIITSTGVSFDLAAQLVT